MCTRGIDVDLDGSVRLKEPQIFAVEQVADVVAAWSV